MKMWNIFSGVFTALLLFALLSVPGAFSFKKDTTDSDDNRSGLAIYVDHGTGVQYVGTILGGLTPRIDADGKVMTVEK